MKIGIFIWGYIIFGLWHSVYRAKSVIIYLGIFLLLLAILSLIAYIFNMDDLWRWCKKIMGDVGLVIAIGIISMLTWNSLMNWLL